MISYSLPFESYGRIYHYSYDENGNVTAIITMEDPSGTVAVSTEDTFVYDERNHR